MWQLFFLFQVAAAAGVVHSALGLGPAMHWGHRVVSCVLWCVSGWHQHDVSMFGVYDGVYDT